VSKQITTSELAEIVTTLLTTNAIDDHLVFSGFMKSIAQVVCDYCGGEIARDPDCWLGEWLAGIHANESLPDDGGIWKNYDLEGEL
jgi:hypothetical protein